jgi:protein-S-isoprenylcysteine O-methyltransferase Ste14
MADGSRGPDIHVPPPILFAAGLTVAWALHRLRPFEIDGAGPAPAQIVAGVVALGAGVGLMGTAVAALRRASTPVLPFRPARTVVTGGPFRFSRNPIYLGMTVSYAGLAVLFNAAWAIVLLPVVLVMLTRLVVEREERHLADAFGAEYETYRARVRRWL